MGSYRFKRAAGFGIVFLISLLVCIWVTGAYINKKCELEYLQMKQLVTIKADKVAHVVSRLLYKTQTLSAIVVQNNGQIKDFERVAATIMDDPSIRNVILAPGGVVSSVYPVEGNEQVIGLDYFAEGEGNKEAVQARDSKSLVLGGPFNLIQGGQALVGRLPVYVGNNNNKFWGIVSVTLNYPEALAGAELDQLKSQGFAFEIWRISPDSNERQVIASSDYEYDKNSQYVEIPLNIMNAEWYFRLSPVRAWYEYPETWVYSISGLMISLLISLLVLHNLDLNHMKRELEDLTLRDTLTGVLNRRGLFKLLEQMTVREGKPFILCYMDLNKFKEVNDTFGHAAGDEVLQVFAASVEKFTGRQHIFARIGGDEFILVIKDCEEAKAVDRLLDNVKEELARALSAYPAEAVSFSRGIALFPKEGKTVDQLIAAADKEMYIEKTGYL